MTFAIDTNNERGLSNEAHALRVTVEEEQGNVVFSIHFALKFA